MAKFDLRAYARAGAETRLRELDEERQAILDEFPDLKRSRAAKKANTIRRKIKESAARKTPKARKKRKPMTAAQKKAVSVRMSKYWAERRKG